LFVFVFSGPKKENIFSIGQKKIEERFLKNLSLLKKQKTNK